MVQRIERDNSRFKQIVRGKIKQDLRKYITHEELIGRQGKDFVSIPISQVEIPHFQYGMKKVGGVGQGEGEIGTPIGRGEEERGGGAGQDPGHHLLEVEISLEELAQILG
ncbi:MAG: DUF444 family protein, partial [Candidatus Latescibacteria bacterium]|nr:DUF444 family protein [Candidatus Latescibacterota bacterium]